MYRINLGLMISTDDLRFLVTLGLQISGCCGSRFEPNPAPSTPNLIFEGQAEYNSTARPII